MAGFQGISVGIFPIFILNHANNINGKPCAVDIMICLHVHEAVYDLLVHSSPPILSENSNILAFLGKNF